MIHDTAVRWVDPSSSGVASETTTVCSNTLSRLATRSAIIPAVARYDEGWSDVSRRWTAPFWTFAGALLLTLGALAPSATAAPDQCLGEDVTMQGSAADDLLTGTPGADVISAGRGWDVILGRGGNDVICGGVGSDRVRGGRGDDRLSGGVDGTKLHPTTRYGDLLAGGAGDDFIDGGDGRGSDAITFLKSQVAVVINLATGTATGQGTDQLVGIDGATGSHFDDTLFSGDFMSVISGANGDDRLVGVGGTPILLGGSGDDRVRLTTAGISLGEGGDDALTARSNSSYSVLLGGRGADSVLASGNTFIRAEGNRGRDQLVTGAGDDELSGNSGADILDGRRGRDEGRGGDGRDSCRRIELSRSCERQPHRILGLPPPHIDSPRVADARPRGIHNLAIPQLSEAQAALVRDYITIDGG